ncbi:response regulator [Paenibacillus xerothermodurans]|uniref:Response regulator n=1 Tax=Paenibacillus xerothermodurans TaxID=1977292 RepID=A0A2W1NAU5_PAEXE|nr:response regulator [Paenibacillus xerothermodurans]PZE20760.1 response regulator [Paenibacillus xerothermodurans]
MSGLLIIDDEAQCREEIRLIIEESQYNYLTVYEAASAERGLFSFKQNQPDIVILDLSLPDMDGVKLGKKIIELNPKVSIVVATQLKMFDMVQMSMNAGFRKYFLKPLSNTELTSALDALLLPNLTKETNYFGKLAASSKPSVIDLGNPIKSVITYIHHHFYEQVTLNEVADWVYLSASHFSRLFKAEMGVTFIEYLTKYRVEQSKRLIKMTSLPIEVIANNTGFTNAGYFATTFKRLEGKTPTEYRTMFCNFMNQS